MMRVNISPVGECHQIDANVICYDVTLLAPSARFFPDLTYPGSVYYLSRHESDPSDRFQRAGARAT